MSSSSAADETTKINGGGGRDQVVVQRIARDLFGGVPEEAGELLVHGANALEIVEDGDGHGRLQEDAFEEGLLKLQFALRLEALRELEELRCE